MSDLEHRDHDATVVEKLQWELRLPVMCFLCGASVPAYAVYWTGITGIERPICYACNYSAIFDSDPQTRTAARAVHPVLGKKE